MAIKYDTQMDQPTNTATISIKDEVTSVSPAEAEAKAGKIDFILGDYSPGLGEVYAGLLAGAENLYRDRVARGVSMRLQQAKKGMLEDLVAQKNGEPVSPEEYEFIMGMGQVDIDAIAQSKDIIETEYGRKYMETLADRDERRAFYEAQKWGPEAANQALDRYTEYAQKQEIAKKYLEDINKRIDDSSTISTVWDHTKNFLDPISGWDLSGVIDGPRVGSLLPGTNREEQYQYLATLPVDRYSEVLQAAYEELAESNYQDARNFLEGAVRYTLDDRVLDNLDGILSGVDVALTATGLGMGVRAGVKAGLDKVSPLRNLLRSGLKANAERGTPDVGKIAAKSGNFKTAAVVAVLKRFAPLGQKIREVTRGNIVESTLPSIANPRAAVRGDNFANLSKRSTEELDDIVADMEARSGIVSRMLSVDGVQVTALPRVAALAEQVWDTLLANELRGIENAILDVAVGQGKGEKYRIGTTELANIERILVALGKTDGTLFDDAVDATEFAQKTYGLPGNFHIRPQGSGYYIEAFYDLPENLDVYRAIPLDESERIKDSFVNKFLNNIRTSKNILSDASNKGREAVVHGSSRFHQLYSEIATPLTKLAKEEMEELKKVLIHNRDERPSIGKNQKGPRGIDFNIDQLDQYFTDTFGHLPSRKQVDAYFAFKQLEDAEYLVRAGSWLRDKLRFGLSHINVPSYKYVAPDGKVSNIKLSFEGKIVDKETFSFNKDTPVTVAVFDEQQGIYKTLRTDVDEDRIELEIIRKEPQYAAYQLTQVADTNLQIKDVSGGNVGIGFVYAPSVTKGPVRLPNIHREGSHVVQRFQFYIKQGVIQADKYGRNLVGDKAVFGAPTRALAAKAAKSLDTVREMIKAQIDELEIDAFAKANLGMTYREVKKLFEPIMDISTGEIIREGLSLDIPIVMTRQGQRTTDVVALPSDVKDVTNSPYNLLGEMNRKYAAERDDLNLWTLQEEDGAISFNTKGELLDPFETLRQSAKNMVDIRFKKDYLTMESNNWIKEFGDLLDVPPNLLEASPMKYLYNPVYKNGQDPDRMAAAANVRKHILRFVGAKNKEDSAFEVMKHKARDIAYDKFGGKGLDVVDNWLIPVVQDPLTFMRSVAFHAKLGLFNPTQFLVQAQAVAAVHALVGNPKIATQATAAMPAMRLAMINSGQISTAADLAEKFGWDRKDFLDMFISFENSGWGIIKGTTGYLDDIANPKIRTTKMGSAAQKVWDMGTVFFDEGERVARLTSYAAAFLEHKAKIGRRQLTRADRQAILTRADDLTMNMSSAHQAVWQRGIAGVPLQFFSYQARLTEAYLGKRLTPKQKMMLFTQQALMYGIPTAAGGVVGVWPVYDSVKSYLIENEIPHDDNVVKSVLNGIPAMISQAAFGVEAEIGPRFGAGGMPTLREWLNDEMSLEEILVGASGSVVGDIALGTVPAIGGLAAVLTGNDEVYGFDYNDVVGAFRNVSTINNGLRTYTALATGRWLTKNGIYVDDVTVGEAFYMGLTGDSLTRITESYTQIESMNQRKEHVKELQSEIMKVIRRGFADPDPKIHEDAVKKAWGIAQAGGLSGDEYSFAVKTGFKSLNESQLESVGRQFSEKYLRAMQRKNEAQ